MSNFFSHWNETILLFCNEKRENIFEINLKIVQISNFRFVYYFLFENKKFFGFNLNFKTKYNYKFETTPSRLCTHRIFSLRSAFVNFFLKKLTHFLFAIFWNFCGRYFSSSVCFDFFQFTLRVCMWKILRSGSFFYLELNFKMFPHTQNFIFVEKTYIQVIKDLQQMARNNFFQIDFHI